MKNIKQLITMIGMMIALITLNGLSVSAVNVDIEGNEMIRSNVSDGLTYEYEITSIEGNEVHGIALNYKEYDNVGIFLYDDELTFDVSIGDVIGIQYGEYKDEFISIELIQ